MSHFIINERIKEIVLLKDKTILFALKRMDEIRKKLLLIYDNEKFLGVLSIGDIQRAIINNISLEEPVSKILRKDIILGYKNESFPEIKRKMIECRSECMPVIDDSSNLIDIYFWEDVFPPYKRRISADLNMPVVIMAGGKGNRLKPITNILPKSLIPIGEKTILEHIMNNFVQVGCNQFLVSLNYKSEMIRHYFNSLKESNYKIEYLQEENPLGTIGSLYLLKGKINQTFFVSNCDIIVDTDYNEIYKYHKENRNEITIVAALKHYKIPYGTIETKEGGELISFKEKPELIFMINSGLYILEPYLIDEIPVNRFYNITELIEVIKKRNGRVGVFPVSEKSWIDIGDWDEYLKNKEFDRKTY